MLRSQLSAVPCTLTMRLLAARKPASFSTAGSGAVTLNRCAAPMPLNTCGNGPLASIRRNSENIVLAGDGMILSIVLSTVELSTCWTTTGNGEAVSTEPIAQAMSSIDSTLTAEPPTASMVVDDRLVIVCRIAAPMEEATNCPTMAPLTRRMTATTSCWVWPPTMAREMAGPNWAPSTAPPTKPMKLSEPTMKPCR